MAKFVTRYVRVCDAGSQRPGEINGKDRVGWAGSFPLIFLPGAEGARTGGLARSTPRALREGSTTALGLRRQSGTSHRHRSRANLGSGTSRERPAPHTSGSDASHVTVGATIER
jgi:hypothetical protein